MEKTGINFQRCNVGCVEAHNERTQAYLDGVKKSGRKLYFFQDLTHLNQSLINPEYEDLTCAEIFEKQKETYTRKIGQKPNLEDRVVTNKKTGKQKTISGWSPLREGVAPIKEDTKLEDFVPFIDWCTEHGLNVIRIDLHFDEGYENAKGERKFNRHAHIVVDWMDWNTGRTAKLDESKMSEAQDVIAAALGMERGKKKSETGAIHLSPAEFKEKAAGEHLLRLEAENERLIEENNILKKDNDTLRNANTGLSAKYIDSWKFKGRAKKAEDKLEAEIKAHGDDLAKSNKVIEDLEKMLEIERKRASRDNSENMVLRERIRKLETENNRQNIAIKHWKDKFEEVTQGNKQDQFKGIGR